MADRPLDWLTADQNASFDWSLQKGVVHWSDLSLYQSRKLLPDASGKEVLFRRCFICHGIQTRMAAVVRDESGLGQHIVKGLEIDLVVHLRESGR